MTVTAAVGQRRMWPLIALVLVCGLPVAAAWLLYLNPALVPAGRAHHGMLIDPPRSLAQVGFEVEGGGVFEAKDFRGKWNLLWVTAAPCADECRISLRKLHNIRVALRENVIRVRTAVIARSAADDGVTRAAAGYSGMAVLSDKNGQFASLLAGAGSEKGSIEGFYIVDPESKLMMRYDSTADPKGILKDLQRLLRYLQSGN